MINLNYNLSELAKVRIYCKRYEDEFGYFEAETDHDKSSAANSTNKSTCYVKACDVLNEVNSKENFGKLRAIEVEVKEEHLQEILFSLICSLPLELWSIDMCIRMIFSIVKKAVVTQKPYSDVIEELYLERKELRRADKEDKELREANKELTTGHEEIKDSFLEALEVKAIRDFTVNYIYERMPSSMKNENKVESVLEYLKANSEL